MNKFLIFLLISTFTFSQKKPEDYGYRHLIYKYKEATVDVIIDSKKGEETIPKPILFWCQGSLPQPIIKYDENGLYSTFPFDVNDFLNQYHIVIIGKPGIPVISDVKNLQNNYCFIDSTGLPPELYSKNNYLDYYVQRNNYILKKLSKEKWVSNKKIVLAGHSEGSSIAAKMAFTNNRITQLIYSGGNPYGRILNIIAESIYNDNSYTIMDYWKEVVDNKNSVGNEKGDSYKTTYDFSEPSAYKLLKLKIPVLICYGTKDWSASYNDMFQVEAIRRGIKNISFIPYIGLEHNYFPVDEKRQPNYESYNWENVGKDWVKWLNTNK
jgi:hypothetical protein